ncbi:MAG: DNA primase [bacterium]
MKQGIAETIREKIDIVDVIMEYMPSLKKAGRNYKACCPFHSERTPSFTVSREKQMFYCFGCHEGGDVFKFVMKMDGSTFPETARKLAEKAGVEWRDSDGLLGRDEKERLEIKRALAFACDFYRKALASPGAEAARRYLASRKVSPGMLEQFELGFAPSGPMAFFDAGKKAGFREEILLKAGLAARGESGRIRDYFRGRIIYPIRNARNEVAGFGGRILGDGEPKYLNSPETPVFSKGRTLYGIYQALPAIRREGKMLVLEGYMDVIGVHQAGFVHAVAPLGTALTAENARALKRWSDDVTLMFDPDEAGARASVKAGEVLMEAGVFVKIARLEEGLDPDDFILKRGKEAFAKSLSSAVDMMEFQADLVLKGLAKPLSPSDKARAAETLLQTVSKQPNEIIRQEWIRNISGKLGVPESALNARLTGRRGPDLRADRTDKSKPADGAAPDIELALIHFLLKYPELTLKVGELSHDDFSSEACWNIFMAIEAVAEQKNTGPGWTASLTGQFPEHAALLTRLVVEEIEETSLPEKEVLRCMKLMRRFSVERRLKDLSKKSASFSREEREEFCRLNVEIAKFKSSKGA